MLASRDPKARRAAGLEHDGERWAERKRALTLESSSRWAGSVTNAGHDQWALARRGQLAHIQSLEAGVRTVAHRPSLPVGEKGTERAPGGYRSKREWHAKTRRPHALTGRLEAARADREAGRVCVVRGGKRLLNNRHTLQAVPPGRGANAVDQNTRHRSGRSAEHEFRQQDSLPLSVWERSWHSWWGSVQRHGTAAS